MNELFLLYLWTRLDAVHELLDVLVGVSLVAFPFTLLIGAAIRDLNSDDTPMHDLGVKMHSSYAKTLIAIFVVGSVLVALLPTKKDVAIIAGGWLVKEASQSEIAKNIGEKTYRLIQGKLDEAIEEVEKKVKK